MIRIMGVLNITPDSFFDGGKHIDFESAMIQAAQMIETGVDIIDIGGESTRPGSESVALELELERVIPVLKGIRKKWPKLLISIDTTKEKIARIALAEGANIINDISAGRMDPKMIGTVAEKGADFIIMHMQGTPSKMQEEPKYQNVVEEINIFFEERIRICLEAGIKKEKLILDPGIGFGKRAEHNYEILAKMENFNKFQLPLLIGLSMKSLLGGDVSERLPGTLALNSYAALNGASILRVHHVKETKKALEALEKLNIQ